METALAEEKRVRAEETKDLQEKLNEDSQRANAVEKQLDKLKEQPKHWLADLKFLNEKLSCEFLF